MNIEAGATGKEANEGVNLLVLYKAMLHISEALDEAVARSANGEYSNATDRQTVERQPDDLADPASEESTRRAETHFTRIRP